MALRPWPAYNLSGARIAPMRFKMDGSAAFTAGDFVYFDGEKEVAEVSGADPATLLGIAAENAANVIESGYVMVYPFTADNVFAMQGSTAPVITDIDVDYGIVESSGVYIVDKTETSNTRVKVVGVDLNRELFFVIVLTANRELG